ncbi:hypothetical protein RIF29_09833 [Crotalaria pallida]|uniref:Uncharacterized protein n=1 Tax=Crotalaria pallida TaxID=3830 RepID=A0AAN9FYG1_CROPI
MDDRLRLKKTLEEGIIPEENRAVASEVVKNLFQEEVVVVEPNNEKSLVVTVGPDGASDLAMSDGKKGVSAKTMVDVDANNPQNSVVIPCEQKEDEEEWTPVRTRSKAQSEN